MSTTVRQYGLIAVLQKPLSPEAREVIEERLYADKMHISTNYEGTLVFFDANKQKPYHVRENIYGLFLRAPANAELRQVMYDELLKQNILIHGDTMQPYNCIYYNGSDSPLALLTKEKFLTETGQK